MTPHACRSRFSVLSSRFVFMFDELRIERRTEREHERSTEKGEV